jgi:hypothetical protein
MFTVIENGDLVIRHIVLLVCVLFLPPISAIIIPASRIALLETEWKDLGHSVF